MNNLLQSLYDRETLTFIYWLNAVASFFVLVTLPNTFVANKRVYLPATVCVRITLLPVLLSARSLSLVLNFYSSAAVAVIVWI